MSEHTKGRWIAVGGWVEHEDDNVADICICDTEIMNQGHLGRSSQEEAANAKLIAAAPDLLEALQFMLDAFTDERWVSVPIVEKAKLAIYRATGEEHEYSN